MPTFMPHRHCYLHEQWLVWVQVSIEAALAICYFAIPVLILLHLRRYPGISPTLYGGGVFYACFIFLCGLTHSVSIVNYFQPHYYAKAVIGGITALVSIIAMLKTPDVMTMIERLWVITVKHKELIKPSLESSAKLEMMETVLANLVDISPSPVAEVAPDGTFLKVNLAFAKLLGTTPQELEGKTFQEVTTPYPLPASLELHQECLDGKRDSYACENEYIHQQTGNAIAVMLSVVAVRNEAKKVVYFISQVRRSHEL